VKFDKFEESVFRMFIELASISLLGVVVFIFR